MSSAPLRVGCLGMGWWSDVLADAVVRSGKIQIVSCYTRSEDKRNAFAKKYGCTAAPTYEAMLADKSIEAIINTTPNDVHLPSTKAAAEAGVDYVSVGALTHSAKALDLSLLVVRP